MRDWRVPTPRRTRATNLQSPIPPTVLELVRAGRPVRVITAELGLAEATVYWWKAQDLIDRGVKPGLSTSERGELAAARQRIKELETELALVTQAVRLFEGGAPKTWKARSFGRAGRSRPSSRPRSSTGPLRHPPALPTPRGQPTFDPTQERPRE
jgi:transposase